MDPTLRVGITRDFLNPDSTLSFGEIGLNACQSILDVAAGRTPQHIVNRAAFNHARLQEMLRQRSLRREVS